jgi:peptidoglycan/LPS O-acetylase OafA/YrhL
LLDTVRWILAGLVALGHAIGLVVAPHADASTANAVLRYFNGLSGGCVIVFFVLSGYLVGGGVLLRRDRFSWRDYTVARFSRIYVVMIPAILLVITLDHLADALAPDSPVYHAVWAPGALGQRSVMSSYSPLDWTGTFLGLASIIGKPLGSGGPLWSLGNEWLFYFLFPAVVVPMRRVPGWLATGAACAALMVALVILHRTPTAAFFLIWMMGGAARVAVQKHAVPRWMAIAGAALAVCAFLVSGAIHHRLLDVTLGFGFATFLARYDGNERGLSRKLDSRLAGASYSLYVCHLTVMAFITMLFHRAGLIPQSGWVAFDVGDVAYIAMLLCAMLVPALAVAWLFARLFEDRTELLRNALSRHLPMRLSPFSRARQNDG